MTERPILNKELDGVTFRSFYYLKEELVSFCRANNLPVSGGKIELTDRIARFLDTGEVLETSAKRKVTTNVDSITEDTQIEANIVCSEKHRAFFKEKIGKSFSFNVLFQKWLKSNAGKTYGDAIEAYYQILEDKKKGKTTIDKQFEYNTYIRDFFEDNQGRNLEDAITCWKYKKSLQGHNRYEQTDLIALENKITLCGDNCIECPRYNAHSEEELQNVAELWYRVGWRDRIVSNEEIRCEGCSSHKACTYHLVDCIEEHNVEKCNQCGEFPCEKISSMLERSKDYQRRCKEVCSDAEYKMLEKAFFDKENNLRK